MIRIVYTGKPTVPLNIRDEDVNQLAERVASLAGTTKTDAVRRALEQELERLETRLSLTARVRPIQAQIAARTPTGLAADKPFRDRVAGAG
jgi:antitoxin VapB